MLHLQYLAACLGVQCHHLPTLMACFHSVLLLAHQVKARHLTCNPIVLRQQSQVRHERHHAHLPNPKRRPTLESSTLHPPSAKLHKVSRLAVVVGQVRQAHNHHQRSTKHHHQPSALRSNTSNSKSKP